ncbi:MAG: hypothetical protein V4696_01490 [Pseudomonadota bacterium]
MSKALKVVAVVAAVVAVAATAVATFGVSLGVSAALAATAATVASVASAVSAAASMGAAALQKRPGLKGSVSQVMIGATMPIPYAIGLTFVGGMQVYDNSGGADNKYRHQVMAVSAAGPIESIDAFKADYANVGLSGESASGWYSSYLTMQKRLGARPETAHTSSLSAMPGWGAAHKMSGYASYRVSMKFDKDGKRFASGVPQFGVLVKGVRVYDPRLDSTYPGGSGAHRWDDEATWGWSENAALHALAYARGRFEGDVKIIGAGIPRDAIDLTDFVELANINDANEWAVGGIVYEAPDLSKWDNLKRILQAGGAKPIWSAGMLRLHISAPRPSLFRIEADDIAEGSVEVRAMKGWRERRNSIVPKYRSPDAKWEYVQGDAVTASTYLAEDGELKTEEVQFDLVQNEDQAAQLAAYEMVNAREFGPINMTVKPRLLAYRLGEAGTVHLPEAGLFEQLAVITGRSVNPATGAVTLTLESETSAKHAYALGLTGTAPPTPTIRSSQELDEAAADAGGAAAIVNVAQSYARNHTISTATGGDVTISAHERVYSDKVVPVDGATVATGLADGTEIFLYYEDEMRTGGTVTYQWVVTPPGIADDAGANPEHPHRHFIAFAKIAMDATDPPSGGGPAWWKFESYDA